MIDDKVELIPDRIKHLATSPDLLGKFDVVESYFSEHHTLDPVLITYIKLLISLFERENHSFRLHTKVLGSYNISEDDIITACANYHHINLNQSFNDNLPLYLFVKKTK